MSNIIFGVLGKSEAEEKLIAAGLSELRDKAAAEGGSFWGVVGLTPESGEQHGAVMDWLIAEGVAFDIVINPSVVDDLPDEYSNACDKMMKAKNVEAKVVSHLAENNGDIILAFIGDDFDQTPEIIAALTKAADTGFTIYDLCDGLAEVSFGEETKDEPEESGDSIDFAALGEAAEGGDADAQAKLTELAEGNIDEDEFATLSWTEAAEKLSEMADEPDSAEDVPAKTAAAKKGGAVPKAKASTKSAPNKWTAEDLDGKEMKELREIAKAAGVEGAGKMSFADLKKALVGVAKGEAPEEAPSDEPDETPEEAPKTKTSAKGKAAAAKTTGASATDGVEEFVSGLTTIIRNILKAELAAQ